MRCANNFLAEIVQLQHSESSHRERDVRCLLADRLWLSTRYDEQTAYLCSLSVWSEFRRCTKGRGQRGGNLRLLLLETDESMSYLESTEFHVAELESNGFTAENIEGRGDFSKSFFKKRDRWPCRPQVHRRWDSIC